MFLGTKSSVCSVRSLVVHLQDTSWLILLMHKALFGLVQHCDVLNVSLIHLSYIIHLSTPDLQDWISGQTHALLENLEPYKVSFTVK